MTTGAEWALEKYPVLPDPAVPRSLRHLNPAYVEFFPETKEVIDDLVQEARDNFQTPFDELFHRQKNAIQNVIEAEKAL